MVATAPITTSDRNGVDAGLGLARTAGRFAVVAAFATIAIILLSGQANADAEGEEEVGVPVAAETGAPSSNVVPPTTADPSAETLEDGLGAASSPGGVMAPTPVPSNMALVAGQDGPAPVEEIDRPTQQASPSVAASSSSVPPVGTSSGTAAADDADAAVISSATHSPPPASLPAPEGEVAPAPDPEPEPMPLPQPEPTPVPELETEAPALTTSAAAATAQAAPPAAATMEYPDAAAAYQPTVPGHTAAPHQSPVPVEHDFGGPGFGGLTDEAAETSDDGPNSGPSTVPSEVTAPVHDNLPPGLANLFAMCQAALPDEAIAGLDDLGSSVPVPTQLGSLGPAASLAPATSVVDSLTAPATKTVTATLDPVVDDLRPTVNEVTSTVAHTAGEVAPDVPVVQIPIVEPQLPGSDPTGPTSPGSGTSGPGSQNGPSGSDDNTTVDEQATLDLFPGPSWNVTEVPGGGVPNSPSAPPPQSGGTDFDGQTRNFDNVTRTQVEQTDHGSSQDDTGHDSEQDGVPAPVPNQIPTTPAAPSSHGGSSGPAAGGSDLGQTDVDAHRLPGTTHLGAAFPDVWRLPGSPSFEPGHSPD
jgi:hypothetical protein